MATERRQREHWLTERVTPISVILSCSCGWRHVESRRQNAWGRAAKLTAAERKHCRTVEAENQTKVEG